MKQIAPALLVLALLLGVGCSGGQYTIVTVGGIPVYWKKHREGGDADLGTPRHPRHYSDLVADERDVRVDPLIEIETEDLLKETSHLGTDRTRDAGKTFVPAPGSTPEGATYLGGAVRVDKIDRFDAENHFGARIRLFNTTQSAQSLEWRVTFLAANGLGIQGLQEEWKALNLEGLDWGTISDGSRIRGAVAFQLSIRKAGAGDEGNPDSR